MSSTPIEGGTPEGSSSSFDAMLSHSKLDITRVSELDQALRAPNMGDRSLGIWLDDREINGGSVVAAINAGLETSRHVVLCLTPNYFASRSGWTHAEWMAGLYDDPAGRMDRVIPVLLEDCPDVPALLRHLDTIDLRPPRRARRAYAVEFARLVRRICGQGRVTPGGGGREHPSTIERAISVAGPDAVPETLVTNLLRAIAMPDTVVVSAIATRVNAGTLAKPQFPSESALRDLVLEATRLAGRRFAPAFRRVGEDLVSFASPRTDRVFATVADDRGYRHEPLEGWLDDPDRRRVIVSLMNAALRDRAAELHLVRHPRHPDRFFFERPLDRTDRKIPWRGSGRPLTVVRALVDGMGAVRYWLHRAVDAKVDFYEGRPYLCLHPTVVLTKDGTLNRVLGGPVVADYARAYVSRERNGHLHRHLLYWISAWSAGTEAVQVPIGATGLVFDARPAQVALPVGIAHDQVKIKGADLQEAFVETRVGDEEAEEEPLDDLTEEASARSDLADLGDLIELAFDTPPLAGLSPGKDAPSLWEKNDERR